MPGVSEDLNEILTQQLFRPINGGEEDNLDSFSQIPEVDQGNSTEQDNLDNLFSQIIVPEIESDKSVAVSDRFALPKSSSEAKAAKAKAIPCNTSKNTKWAVNIWKEWSQNRRRNL